jgi:energy-coupling factor transporter ATP-binding protein EcfA2
MDLAIVNLCYEINHTVILNNINLHIKKGTIACLRGPTGAGKTTLGLIISGILPSGLSKDDVSMLPRHWQYLVGNLRADKISRLSPAIYLPQNPLDTLIFPSVEDELFSITDDMNLVLECIKKVGLPQYVLESLKGDGPW